MMAAAVVTSTAGVDATALSFLTFAFEPRQAIENPASAQSAKTIKTYKRFLGDRIRYFLFI